MTKQEEIREEAIIITKDQLWREGIRDKQRLAVGAIQIVDGIFSRLHFKGVVIKVEGDNKDCRGCVGTGMIGGAGINDCCPDCNGTGKVFCVGYVAWEPLI